MSDAQTKRFPLSNIELEHFMSEKQLSMKGKKRKVVALIERTEN